MLYNRHKNLKKLHNMKMIGIIFLISFNNFNKKIPKKNSKFDK